MDECFLEFLNDMWTKTTDADDCRYPWKSQPPTYPYVLLLIPSDSKTYICTFIHLISFMVWLLSLSTRNLVVNKTNRNTCLKAEDKLQLQEFRHMFCKLLTLISQKYCIWSPEHCQEWPLGTEPGMTLKHKVRIKVSKYFQVLPPHTTTTTPKKEPSIFRVILSS